MKSINVKSLFAGVLGSLVIAIALGIQKPETRPTTFPATTQPVETSLANLKQAERSAEQDAMATLRKTQDYKAAKAKADAAQSKLESARASGSAEQKLSASHDFVIVDQVVKGMERKAIESSPQVATARTKIKDAQEKTARDLREEKIAQAEERLRIENDPINVAIRSGRITVGMTEDQAFEAYKNRKESNQTANGPRYSAGEFNPNRMAIPAKPVISFKKVENFTREDVKGISFRRYSDDYLEDRVDVTIKNGRVLVTMSQ